MPELSADQFRRLEELFHQARALDAPRRDSFLASACAGEPELRRQVEELLASGAKSGADDPRTQPFSLFRPLRSSLAVARSLVEADQRQLLALVGTRVGAYQLTGLVGRGGMGAVFRARDVRLGRSVAVKIVPPELAGDDSRLARFLREAKTLASVSHPNVATVHGLEEMAGAHFLVMEFLEGETLAARLSRGPMSIPDALATCAAIAAGVEAAHAAGVIHRDLKPANVILTSDAPPRVKVLDFGLAREIHPHATPGPAHATHLLTHPDAITSEHHVVLGTPGYMSPEQVRGRPVDRRTDVFALGCILFECLTRKLAFPGGSGADVIAAVLERQPDWATLPLGTPPPIKRLLERSLAKDPDRRLRDVGDFRLELEDALAEPPSSDEIPTPPGPRRRSATLLPWLIAAAAVIALATLPFWRHREAAPAAHIPEPQASSLRRFPLNFPNNTPQSDLPYVGVALTRDGSRMLLAASENGQQHLWLRERGDIAFRKVEGTQRNWLPAFSPDGEWFVYSDGGIVQKKRLAGGNPVRLVELSNALGYHWGSDNFITYIPFWGKGVARIPSSGGAAGPAYLSRPDFKTDFAHIAPFVLPDNSAVLFASWDGKADTRIDAVRLPTGQRHTVVDKGSTPRVAYTSSGVFLCWERAGTLFAAPFDPKALRRTGPEAAIADGVLNSRTIFRAAYDVADDGTLVYVPGPAFAEESRLGLLDPEKAAELRTRRRVSLNLTQRLLTGRTAEPSPPPPPPPPPPQTVAFNNDRLPFGEPCFTADGKRLSVLIKDDVYRPYIYDLERDAFSRVIVNADVESAAISPDGQYLAFSSNIDGPYALWLRRLGDGHEEKLQAGTGIHQCTIRWSPDGRYIVSATMAEEQTTRDIWVVDLHDRSKKPWVFTGGASEERAPAFSPDGKWLAYCSDESGAREIYVRSFPDPVTRIQVSRTGGDWPRWAPHWSDAGGRLYFRNDKDKLFSIDVNPAAGAPAGPPRLIYDKRFGQSDYELTDYTVAPDGNLLLIEPSERGPRVSQIHVVLNWPRLLAAAPHRH